MNDFQKWMVSRGYEREYITWGAWLKDGKVVSGKELSDLLTEYKKENSNL